MDKSLIEDTIRYIQENHTKKEFFLVKEEASLPTPGPVFLDKAPLTPASAPPVIKTPFKKTLPLSLPPKPQKPLPAPSPLPKKEKSLPFSSMAKQVHALFPSYPIHDTPLEDEGLFVRALCADVVLFSFNEGKSTELFLQNLAKAIKGHLGSSSVFFVKKWDNEDDCSLFLARAKARLFIGPPALLQSPIFLPFIKELPVSSRRFLQEKPLVILKPFTEYFAQPSAKKELWEVLCGMQKLH